MIAALAFVPLLAGWALLHRASRRPGWGYVGGPPTKLELALRSMAAFAEKLAALRLAIRAATERALVLRDEIARFPW